MLDVSSVIENMKLLHGKPLCFLSGSRDARTISASGHVLLLCAEKPHRFQSLLSAGTGGTPALEWDRIPSQAQAACFCRKQNMNIQLKLCLPIADVCVCVRMRQMGSLVAAGGQFPMCSTIKGS